MKASLRNVLADSHVAAVSIVVLLVFSLIQLVSFLQTPLLRFAGFLFNAIAILDIPNMSGTITVEDRVLLFTKILGFFYAFVCVVAAWALSRWVYGTGPLRALSEYPKALPRRNHV